MPLLYRYWQLRARSPIRTLGGRLTRPKPIIQISVTGPAETRLTDALLDTGADDTVFPDSLAARIGVDLTNADEVEASGVGIAPAARLRIARVMLRLATNTAWAEWTALVCFTSAPLRFPLLGYAGCLQYFDADFKGGREEVELTADPLLPGTASG